MVAAILATVGVLALAIMAAGLMLPNPDAERIDRINAKRERERIRHRERAARLKARRKGGAS